MYILTKVQDSILKVWHCEVQWHSEANVRLGLINKTGKLSHLFFLSLGDEGKKVLWHWHQHVDKKMKKNIFNIFEKNKFETFFHFFRPSSDVKTLVAVAVAATGVKKKKL